MRTKVANNRDFMRLAADAPADVQLLMQMNANLFANTWGMDIAIERRDIADIGETGSVARMKEYLSCAMGMLSPDKVKRYVDEQDVDYYEQLACMIRPYYCGCELTNMFVVYEKDKPETPTIFGSALYVTATYKEFPCRQVSGYMNILMSTLGGLVSGEGKSFKPNEFVVYSCTSDDSLYLPSCESNPDTYTCCVFVGHGHDDEY